MDKYAQIQKAWNDVGEMVGVNDLRRAFNAYGWLDTADIRMSKDDHWSGWWNDCYHMVTIWGRTQKGQEMVVQIGAMLCDSGFEISGAINNGISVFLRTMTAEESHKKAERNLLHGGRMSD